nr:DUF5522 domain-containing protein [Chitinophagaceae bacterium]
MKKPLFDDQEMVYFNSEGNMVMTEAFLLKRGYCCGNGCLHCPFEYKNVTDETRRLQLISDYQARQ